MPPYSLSILRIGLAWYFSLKTLLFKVRFLILIVCVLYELKINHPSLIRNIQLMLVLKSREIDMKETPERLKYLKSDRIRKVFFIKSLEHPTYIFEENFSEFHKVHKRFRDAGGKEIQRTLHNFLMSSSTLIDHTRNMSRKLPEISKTYESKVQEMFANSNLSFFIKDLRNYIAHYAIPLTMTKLELSETTECFVGCLVMDKQYLLQWRGWSIFGKNFLEEWEGNIELFTVLVRYYNIVAEFHNWFESHLQCVYRTLLEEYDEFEKGFQLILE